MIYFHCTPDRTDWLQHRPGVNVLASAYRIRKFPKIMDYLHLANDTFLDSGMISAWSAGDDWWHKQTDFILGVATAGRFRRVAMLDLPCEPNFLEANGWSLRRALLCTQANARRFMDAKVPGTKVLVVQGWEPKHYKACINHYHRRGYFKQACWVGIGSVCRRTPKNGLYDICQLVREELPNKHVHAFGIGKPEWIRRLEEIGIDSTDSSTASTRVGFNRVKSVKRTAKRTDRQVRIQFAREMLYVENELRGAGVQLRDQVGR